VARTCLEGSAAQGGEGSVGCPLGPVVREQQYSGVAAARLVIETLGV
jgi:hypothetical protein